jgi:hypothetical protein
MSDKVGPGNPPISGQFPKGKSGNPNGRPRKVQDKPSGSAVDVIIDKSVMITKGGIARQVTTEEALLHQTLMKALEGNKPAMREMLKLIEKRDTALAKSQAKKGAAKIESVIEPHDPTNAHEAMRILNIADTDPSWTGSEYGDERLLLEPWAVQVALSRRRGGKRLTERQVEDIHRQTRDPGSLRWPRSAGK